MVDLAERIFVFNDQRGKERFLLILENKKAKTIPHCLIESQLLMTG